MRFEVLQKRAPTLTSTLAAINAVGVLLFTSSTTSMAMSARGRSQTIAVIVILFPRFSGGLRSLMTLPTIRNAPDRLVNTPENLGIRYLGICHSQPGKTLPVVSDESIDHNILVLHSWYSQVAVPPCGHFPPEIGRHRSLRRPLVWRFSRTRKLAETFNLR